MNKERQKSQKKKEREREVHAKILRRRARTRAEAKVEADKAREEMINQAMVNKHTVTVNYNANDRLSEEEIKEKLTKNMQILQALEDEYNQLQKQREENAKNPPDFSALAINKPKSNLGGSAGVEFKPNVTEDIFNDQPVGNGLKPADTEEIKDV